MSYIKTTFLAFSAVLLLCFHFRVASSSISSCSNPEPSSNACNEETIPAIVVFGRTGAGKSAFCNKIAGTMIFTEGNTLTSETSVSVSHVVSWPQDPLKKIRLIDTPGFGDNRASQKNEHLLANILSFLKELKGGFNIGIFCIRAQSRIDAHDIDELNMIGMLLGNSVFKHTFIVITQTNTLVHEQREKVFRLYSEELPQILANNGMPWFTKDRILFADFDKFNEMLLNPLGNIIQRSNSFIPNLPTNIDLNNPESIKVLLQGQEIQAWMKKQQEKNEELEIRKTINELSQKQLSYEKLIHEKNQRKQQIINQREQNSISYNQDKITIERRINEIRHDLEQTSSSYNNQNAQTQLRIQQLNQELNQKLMVHQDLVVQLKELEQKRLERRQRHGHHPHHRRHGHHGHHHGRGRQRVQELNIQIQQSLNVYENKKAQNQNEIHDLNVQLNNAGTNLHNKQVSSNQQVHELNVQLESKLNNFNQMSHQTQNEINMLDNEINGLSNERSKIMTEIEQKRKLLKE